MNTQYRFILFSTLTAYLLLMGLLGCGPGEEKKPVLDTKFTIAYKLVDGSWDTSAVIGASSTKFWVDAYQGTYHLVYASDPARIKSRQQDNTWKSAVIDFNIISTETVLDTTTKPVELRSDSMTKRVEFESDPNP